MNTVLGSKALRLEKVKLVKVAPTRKSALLVKQWKKILI
jgi:hypothetical protein